MPQSTGDSQMSVRDSQIFRRSGRLRKRAKMSQSVESSNEESSKTKAKRGRRGRRGRRANDSGEESLYDINLDSEHKDSGTEPDFDEDHPILLVGQLTSAPEKRADQARGAGPDRESHGDAHEEEENQEERSHGGGNAHQKGGERPEAQGADAATPRGKEKDGHQSHFEPEKGQKSGEESEQGVRDQSPKEPLERAERGNGQEVHFDWAQQLHSLQERSSHQQEPRVLSRQAHSARSKCAESGWLTSRITPI